MAFVALGVQGAKQCRKIEIALTGKQMLLLAVTEAVGEPNFRDEVERDRREEAFDALGNQVRVIGGER